MSVNKVDRGESKFGTYDQARRIREMVNDFLDRDFGIKASRREIRNASVGKYRRLEDGSTEFYVRMPKQPEKHNRIEDYYIFLPEEGSTSESGTLTLKEVPAWKLEKYRDELWENARKVAECVRRANSIYAYYPSEYFERRDLQDQAIAACYALHDSLLVVTEDLPVTLEKIDPIIRLVKKEISAVREWRKGENGVLSICMKHEEQRRLAVVQKMVEQIVSAEKERIAKDDDTENENTDNEYKDIERLGQMLKTYLEQAKAPAAS